MEACFSAPSLALLATVGAAIQATIVALFVALMRSKDAQIQREQDLNSQLTQIALSGTRGTEVATTALRAEQKRR